MSMLDTLAGLPEVAPTLPVVVTPEVQEPEKSTGDAHVTIVPYNALADPQSDDFLHWMWKRMQTDDLVDYYFPGQKDTGFATFVRLFSGDAQIALILNESESKKWEDRVMGFLTWTPTRLGASDMIIAGFVFFKKFWGHAHTDEASQAAFKFWFSQEPHVDVVLGLCPSLHQMAIRYNLRVGLHEIGRIPKAHVYKGKSCDAILYAISREQWEAKEHR